MALPGRAVLLLGVGMAVALAALLWLPRRPRPLEVLGAALVAYPIARALVGSALVSDRLTRYTVLLPASVQAFELSILRQVTLGLLLPLAGALLLWKGQVPREPWRGWGDAREALTRALAPAGVRLDRSPARAMAEALALLGVVLLLLALSLAAQTYAVPFLVTGDESAYWINLTPALLLGLSLAAGIGEEFVWRGLLLRALMGRMAWLPALAVQAALFGFIHAGYGNWAHVVGPALFGALMGLVALRVSLLAAIVVHAGIDVAYLSLVVPALQPAILALPAALLLAGLVMAWRLRFAPVRAVLAAVPGLRRWGAPRA